MVKFKPVTALQISLLGIGLGLPNLAQADDFKAAQAGLAKSYSDYYLAIKTQIQSGKPANTASTDGINAAKNSVDSAMALHREAGMKSAFGKVYDENGKIVGEAGSVPLLDPSEIVPTKTAAASNSTGSGAAGASQRRPSSGVASSSDPSMPATALDGSKVPKELEFPGATKH